MELIFKEPNNKRHNGVNDFFVNPRDTEIMAASEKGWYMLPADYTVDAQKKAGGGADDGGSLGLTGAEAALPIWTAFMQAALDTPAPGRSRDPGIIE